MTSNFTMASGGGFTFSIFQQPTPPPPQVYRSNEGVGYPSCSRALMKIPPNRNDANGYYKTLGLDPSATLAEIKKAGRRLLRENHPDTEPEDCTEEQRAARRKIFDRIKEILSVLTDPIHKMNYDSIQQGRKLIDSEVLAEMEEQGIAHNDPGIEKFANAPDGDPDHKGPNRKERRRRAKDKMWDYLATDHNEMDLVNVQEWYAYLLKVAPMVRFEGVIKVLMHDGKSSAFKPMGGILLVPRRWEPSLGLAMHMMLRHIGWPDTSKPRYPVPHLDPSPRFGPFFGTGVNGGGGLLISASGNNLPVMRQDVGPS